MSAIQSDRRDPDVEHLDAFPAPPFPGRRGANIQGRFIPYVLILPAVLVLIGVLGYPLVRVVLLAFQNVNTYLRLAVPTLDKWIGFAGFSTVLSHSQFL